MRELAIRDQLEDLSTEDFTYEVFSRRYLNEVRKAVC